MKSTLENKQSSKNEFNISEVFPDNRYYIHNIRKGLITLVNDYIERHSKALATRFTLTFPSEYSIDPAFPYVSRFIAKLIQYLNRKGYDGRYLYVREQKTGEHPHYHFVVLVNGNKIQHPRFVTNAAKKFWNSTLGLDKDKKGYVNYDCCQMIRRNDKNFYEQKERAFIFLRYLAKVLTKGKKHDGIRNVAMSRIKPVPVTPPPQSMNLFG